MARHGQTSFNVEGRIGGGSDLTLEGIAKAEKVAELLKNAELDVIYCSNLQRSIHTAAIIYQYHRNSFLIKNPCLAEISAGDFDGIIWSEFKKNFPEHSEARKKDKYSWAFPNGESYITLTERISPFLETLKSKEGNSLVVGHNAVNRAIIGYLCSLKTEEIPHLKIPQDMAFEISLTDGKIWQIKDGEKIEGYKISKENKKDK